jgi:hypothetical protein
VGRGREIRLSVLCFLSFSSHPVCLLRQRVSKCCMKIQVLLCIRSHLAAAAAARGKGSPSTPTLSRNFSPIHSLSLFRFLSLLLLLLRPFKRHSKHEKGSDVVSL